MIASACTSGTMTPPRIEQPLDRRREGVAQDTQRLLSTPLPRRRARHPGPRALPHGVHRFGGIGGGGFSASGVNSARAVSPLVLSVCVPHPQRRRG
jgi:hypothetical protein